MSSGPPNKRLRKLSQVSGQTSLNCLSSQKSQWGSAIFYPIPSDSLASVTCATQEANKNIHYYLALPMDRIKRCTPSVSPSVSCHSVKQESDRNFWFGVKFIVNIVLDKNNWGAHLRSQGTKMWKSFHFTSGNVSFSWYLSVICSRAVAEATWPCIILV